MRNLPYRLINSITIYRIMAAPVLVMLAVIKEPDWYKWLLVVSFGTDLVDGYLSRRFKVSSILGAKLDSIGDDLTILAGIVGLLAFRFEFVLRERILIIFLLSLFFIQIFMAFYRYKKMTSFHTYLSKIAAILQGIFFILIFMLPEPLYLLFYLASAITALALVEEMIIIIILPVWMANLKGLYWILKKSPVKKI